MAFPRHKYAVIAGNLHPDESPGHRLTIHDIRAAKLRELKLKKAVDRAVAVLERLEARAARYQREIAAIDAQMEAAKARKRAALARAERIEEQILARLDAAHVTRAVGFETEIHAQPCPPSLVVDPDAEIPREYLRSEPDKNLIKRVLARAEADDATEEELAAAARIKGVRLMQRFKLRYTRSV